ncbi:MAG: ABC transporter substrate-binding protein [Deltaproteobacteria bacterium]|nr:ABC transporter substrate-binding protein [Deltaproteobacteria bacterium]
MTLCLIAWLLPALTTFAADPIKLGLVLPYSSVYATLGQDITNGLELALEKAGGQVAGRKFEVLKQDSQVDPKVGLQVTTRFIQQDQVDFLIGPVASHVAMAMRKAAHDSQTFLIIPNAGADSLTREQCSPYIFRTSFSNWQPYQPMGVWMAKTAGIKKVSLMAPNYAAGKQALDAFKEGFLANGGQVVSEQYPALKEVDYQPFLTKVLQDQPQALFVFFAGSDAVKFVQQYAQSGLNKQVPLYSSGFLVEGAELAAQGEAALGIKNSMHYADTLDNPANKRFVADFKKKFNQSPSLYAMQGYDSGQVLVQALTLVKGNTKDKAALQKALETVSIESPRGPFRFSKSHNPVQNIYIREVVNGSQGMENRIIGRAVENLEDPGTGCSL